MKGECSLVGCSNDAYCRGWCVLHYSRWQRHGDPMKASKSIDERFWEKVNKGAECWLLCSVRGSRRSATR
jgi:hypothetical protein